MLLLDTELPLQRRSNLLSLSLYRLVNWPSHLWGYWAPHEHFVMWLPVVEPECKCQEVISCS
jgi:hypothetical protein